jgi:hypothetical protein
MLISRMGLALAVYWGLARHFRPELSFPTRNWLLVVGVELGAHVLSMLKAIAGEPLGAAKLEKCSQKVCLMQRRYRSGPSCRAHPDGNNTEYEGQK